MLSVAMETGIIDAPSLPLSPSLCRCLSPSLRSLQTSLGYFAHVRPALHLLQDGETTSGLPPDSPLNSL